MPEAFAAARGGTLQMELAGDQREIRRDMRTPTFEKESVPIASRVGYALRYRPRIACTPPFTTSRPTKVVSGESS